MTAPIQNESPEESVDYDTLVDLFNQALIHTLRKHNVAGSFLDFWVPDADPVVGIAGMIDSARIGGLKAITIQIQRSTVPAERMADLERILARICTLDVQQQKDTMVLRAKNLRQADLSDAPQEVLSQRPRYWQPEADGSRESGASISDRWDRTELPNLSDVHPHFRAALNSVRTSHEGKIEANTMKGLKLIEVSDDSIKLAFAIDPNSHIVHTARHSGATKPSDRAILDLFCRAAEMLPIQEVADHTPLKVLNSLVDEDKAPPVRGVLLPANAGVPFLLPGLLARRAYDAYRQQSGTDDGINFYSPPPKPEWQALSTDQRWEKVDYTLRGFLQSEGLYPDDMNVLQIGKNKYGYDIRVVVGFSERVAVEAKPSLMRQLERRLRREVEPEIDLVAARAKDTSPLRRLS